MMNRRVLNAYLLSVWDTFIQALVSFLRIDKELRTRFEQIVSLLQIFKVKRTRLFVEVCPF